MSRPLTLQRLTRPLSLAALVAGGVGTALALDGVGRAHRSTETLAHVTEFVFVKGGASR